MLVLGSQSNNLRNKKTIYNMKSLITLLLLIITITAKSQSTDTLYIQTSSVCENCKARIEKNMSFEKGVKTSDLNIEKKTLMVVYNPSKTTPENLRVALTAIGYDADSL